MECIINICGLHSSTVAFTTTSVGAISKTTTAKKTTMNNDNTSTGEEPVQTHQQHWQQVK